MKHQFLKQKTEFFDGVRDGIPIGAGYFAVSFSLGIAARKAGLSAFQGLLVSALNNASAGEYAGFIMIAANASYLEAAFITLITNARYFLMSCALSQKLKPDTPLYHRFFIGFDVTDEIFGISIARKGFLDPRYAYGAIAVALPCWAFGTMFGVIAGNLLPLRIVSALGVALYGMFLAVIIPQSRNDRTVAALVLISFVTSFAAVHLPLVSAWSEGTRTIVLTLLISAVAAFVRPVDKKEEEDDA